MKKEITFSSKLDTAEFDRNIEMMQRKLKEMYAPGDQVRQQSQWANRMENMGMSGASRPTQQAYQAATQQSRREMDQFLATEVKRQTELSKTIEKRVQKLNELKKTQQDLNKGSEEELKIKEKISRMEENNFRLREIERGRSQQINQTFDAREKLNPSAMESVVNGYKTGGIRGAASAGTDYLKTMGPSQMATMIGGVLSATGVAAQIGGELYRSYKQAPINTASSYGSAMTGVYGREVSAAYSGRSALEMAFLPEKQRAMDMARAGMSGERVGNGLGLAGTVLGYAGAGMGIGAGIGGAAGLGIGAVPGAILGGLGGAGVGLYRGMTGEGGARNSALVKGAFSSTHNAEYESMMAQEFAQKYGTALQGLKEQNPFKTAAADQYDGNYMRYLDTQRSMGLNNGNFHGAGGFRENAINSGFTDDMAMGASSGILGAGGSTRMARNSVFALQAGRQFDQTNAGSVLGSLSNSLGSSQASQQAYIKMLAEGTRQGLDSSEYREESRKMMEVTAQVVNKSGATGSSDIDRVITQMGGFLNDKTGKGIQSSKEAFDYYNQASSDVGGARGVMRASGMMQNGVLGQMDAMDRNSLAGISGDQLDSNDPMIKHLAQKYNTTPEDIIKARLDVDKQGFNFRPGTDKAMNRATDLRKQLQGLGPGDDEKRKDLQGQLDSAMGELNVGLSVDNPNLSPRTRQSLAQGLTSSSPDAMQKALKEAAISDQLSQKGGTGRMEDTSVQGAAESSRVVLENFNKFSAELVQSPEAIRQFNSQLAKTVEILQKLDPQARAKAYEQMGFGSSTTQPQSGKSGK